MVWVYQRVTYPKLSQTKANKKNQHHVDCTGSGSKHCNRLLRGRKWSILLQAVIERRAGPARPGPARSLPTRSSRLQAIAQPRRQRPGLGQLCPPPRTPLAAAVPPCLVTLRAARIDTVTHTRRHLMEFVPSAHPAGAVTWANGGNTVRCLVSVQFSAQSCYTFHLQ